MFENIPNDLRSFPQWVVWKFEETINGKPTKVPFSPRTGQHASVNDPSTWATFEDACQASSWFNGIGFVFTDNDPFTGIDLDDTEGDSEKLQRQIKVHSEFDSYSEYSPSGKGLHIIVKGRVPTGRRRSCIEVYSTGRFFTMTGNVYHPAQVADRNELLQVLWQQMGGAATVGGYDGNAPQTLSDFEVVEAAGNASNGDKFRTLYEGRWTELYPSQSEADFALVDILAFYTQNREQLNRIFRSTPLGKRAKAQRNDYMAYMVNKSFDRLLPPVDIDGLKIGLEEALARKQNVAAALPAPKPRNVGMPFELPANPYTIPPGLLGDIAKFIFQASPRPVEEVALTAAIGLMAGVCGQAYNVSNSGLNLYLMLLAPTGRGKEAMASGVDRLMSAIMNSVPASTQFRGPGEIASGQALIKHMSKGSPAILSIVGEFGYRLEAMAGSRANPSDLMLKRILLDLYNKSGQSQTYHPMIYADKEKNTTAITSPAFTLLGESTPSTFYNIVDEAMIEDGLLPRFVIIEYDGKRPELNENHAHIQPSFQLVDQFSSLVAGCLDLMSSRTGNRRVVNVGANEGAQELLREFDKYADLQMNTSSKEVVQHLWNRAHMNLLRLSALVAVGCDPYNPTVNEEVVVWARGIIVTAINKIMMRFETGMVGRTSEEGRQTAEIVRIIRDYLEKPAVDFVKYGVERKLHADMIIPYQYLQKRLSAVACFRNDRMGATNAMKRAVGAMLDSGEIREIGKGELGKNYGQTGRAFMVANPSLFL